MANSLFNTIMWIFPQISQKLPTQISLSSESCVFDVLCGYFILVSVAVCGSRMHKNLLCYYFPHLFYVLHVFSSSHILDWQNEAEKFLCAVINNITFFLREEVYRIYLDKNIQGSSKWKEFNPYN